MMATHTHSARIKKSVDDMARHIIKMLGDQMTMPNMESMRLSSMWSE